MSEEGQKSAAAKGGAEKHSKQATQLAGWELEAWIKSLALDGVVASAMLKHLGGRDGSAELSKRFMGQLGSCGKEVVFAMLQDAMVLEELAVAVWEGTQTLSEQLARRKQSQSAASVPPDASQLNSKFVSEGAHALSFADLSEFYGGLDALVGRPRPDQQAGMEQEHCARPDASTPFDVPNYGTRTVSFVEYVFVADPSASGLSKCAPHLKQLGVSGGWPREASMVDEPSLQKRCRQPVPPDSMRSKGWDEVNRKLAALGAEQLTLEEVVGARLYTGPCYRKYNAVLRGCNGKVPALHAQWKALCAENRYETTLHVITSAIGKMGKVQSALMLFRAPGGALPAQFLSVNEVGVSGGVELSFMSCTTSREVALEYAVSSKAAVVFQIEEGFVDRGADLSWLSQCTLLWLSTPRHIRAALPTLALLWLTPRSTGWHPLLADPHEREITFPPLTTLEVKGKHVDGSVLVVHLVPRLRDQSRAADARSRDKGKSSVCAVM